MSIRLTGTPYAVQCISDDGRRARHEEMATMGTTTSTGHELTIDAYGGYLHLSGDIDTMGCIPESEIDAACAAAGVRCTYEAVDATTYRVEAAS